MTRKYKQITMQLEPETLDRATRIKEELDKRLPSGVTLRLSEVCRWIYNAGLDEVEAWHKEMGMQ